MVRPTKSWTERLYSLFFDTLTADLSRLKTDGNSNVVSAENSSTTPLGIAGVFTGAWVDVSAYPEVMVAVTTDADGVYAIQFSPDGTNVDSSLTRYYRTNQINPPHRFTVARSYFRVVFTNGSVAQTQFRLQTLLGVFGELNAPTDGILSRAFDATAVRPTLPNDEVVLGLRQGYFVSLKFGYNESVSTGAAQLVAPFGGQFTFLTAASTLTISSSSVADIDVSGTGARSILVSGLDANRLAKTEIIALNGTTDVVTTSTWLGINRTIAYDTGSSRVNAGDVTITATTGGSIMAQVPAGKSITQQVIFHVQAGHNGLIRRIYLNVLKTAVGQSPVVAVELKVWNPSVTDTVYTLRRFKLDSAVSNDLERDYPDPILLSPTDVAWFTITTDQASTSVDIEMDVTEVKQVNA